MRTLTISPDGRQLAFLAWDQKGSIHLAVMPVAGGEPRQLAGPVHWSSPVAWTPDGRHLISAGVSELWRISTEGKEPQRVAPAMEQLSDLRIHPDGRWLVFSAGQHRAEVWVMENFLPALRAAR